MTDPNNQDTPVAWMHDFLGDWSWTVHGNVADGWRNTGSDVTPLYSSEQFDRMRERAERAEAERDALKQAVAPFCDETIKTWVDEHGWTAIAPSRDRICDWFGPSDFRTLLTKLQDTSHASDQSA